jgi:uracil-DNA glycosylase
VALDLVTLLPAPWRAAMGPHLDPSTVAELCAFVSTEYEQHEVFPPLADLFAAFRLCPPESTRAVILGQDPYHAAGQAHGLSFSVPAGVRVPPSLRNVFKELRDDLGVDAPTSGDLTAWAEQGVLLLNTVLTVRSGKPGSHARKGWEHVTDAAIRALDARTERIVFLLWGAHAQKKKVLLTSTHHVVLEAGHPSPMNPKGFLGTRPFSACNAALAQAGRDAIRW